MSNYKKKLNIYKTLFKKNYIKNSKKRVCIKSRNTIITKKLVGSHLYIYNGKKFKFLKFKKEMVGFKFGEFVKTRIAYNINKPKKKKK